MALSVITVTGDCGNPWTCELMGSVSLGIFLSHPFNHLFSCISLLLFRDFNYALSYVLFVDAVSPGANGLSL